MLHIDGRRRLLFARLWRCFYIFILWSPRPLVGLGCLVFFDNFAGGNNAESSADVFGESGMSDFLASQHLLPVVSVMGSVERRVCLPFLSSGCHVAWRSLVDYLTLVRMVRFSSQVFGAVGFVFFSSL